MNNTKPTPVKFSALKLVVGLLLMSTLFIQTFAQTAADTQIQNQASATYSDGNGNNFSTVSNTVTVTVAKVAGLTITPDGQTNSTVVPGQTGVGFVFRVTNTGNFTDQVKFLASGASLRVTGPATITAASYTGPNVTTAVSVFGTNPVVNQSLAQNDYVDVTVTLSVSSTATPTSTIQVFLGDATTGTNFDNVASNTSANEVRTVSTGAVNGSREARGDISVTVDNDGLLKTVLTVPAGPVALGSDISYSVKACNDGQRTLNPVTPPVGATKIFIYIPIPLQTVLKTGQTYPTGTEFSVTALTTAPASAVWTTTAPTTLANVVRIRIPAASSLTSANCSASFTYQVTITAANANTPIYAISETFANNSLGNLLTDQSGDTITNRGDGNADFDEPLFGQPATSNQGIQLPTLLSKIGNVLIGPAGSANANGPSDSNDDYTNRSVTTGIAGVAPSGVTTASGVIIFTNTVKNTGNANDTFTLSSPTVPTGFLVEISTDNGVTYTTVMTTAGVASTTTIAISFGQSKDIKVRITAPTGKTVLTAYSSVVRAVSGLTSTNQNDTIDRLYTGFIKMVKAYSILNTTVDSTGVLVGTSTDPVPGAVITYTITYTNVSSPDGLFPSTAAVGTGNSPITASNLVITEDGAVAPNNWATYTDHVVGATDTLSGTITGDALLSTVLTDTVSTIAPGASGVFTFKRVIK
jgi:hypothetical protein